MRVAVIDRYGGVHGLRLRDVPMPDVGNSALPVEVFANPVDGKVREGLKP